MDQTENLKILETRAILSIRDMVAQNGLEMGNVTFQDDSSPCHRAKRVRFFYNNKDNNERFLI